MNILFFLKPKSNIAYINDHYTLRQALEKMKYYGYSAIPMIDAEGKYTGTLSEGDLLWAILEHNAYEKSAQETLNVKDILQGWHNTPVNVNASIEDLLQMAVNQNFIPVVDDRNLFIGIVTRKDILQYYYEKMHPVKNLSLAEMP
jgi:CBS domain-containing protein